MGKGGKIKKSNSQAEQSPKPMVATTSGTKINKSLLDDELEKREEENIISDVQDKLTKIKQKCYVLLIMLCHKLHHSLSQASKLRDLNIPAKSNFPKFEISL